jgi:hypothetical protein
MHAALGCGLPTQEAKCQYRFADDHFAEDRIAAAADSGDEIHLFHRPRHHTDFTCLGEATLTKLERHGTGPSYFEYTLAG